MAETSWLSLFLHILTNLILMRLFLVTFEHCLFLSNTFRTIYLVCNFSHLIQGKGKRATFLFVLFLIGNPILRENRFATQVVVSKTFFSQHILLFSSHLVTIFRKFVCIAYIWVLDAIYETFYITPSLVKKVFWLLSLIRHVTSKSNYAKTSFFSKK